mgnify:CR=1 FL=1
MGQIIELRPLRQQAPGVPRTEAPQREVASVDEAVQRLGGSVAELIRTLEESHRRIRLVIYSIPDAAVAARLTQDLADLSAALGKAKAKACATGLIPRE